MRLIIFALTYSIGHWACLQAQDYHLIKERTDVSISDNEPLYLVADEVKRTVINQKGQKLYTLADDIFVKNVSSKVALLFFNEAGYLLLYSQNASVQYYAINRQGALVFTFPPHIKVMACYPKYFVCYHQGKYGDLNMYGIMSADCRQLTPYKYYDIEGFSDGLAVVKIATQNLDYYKYIRYGYINERGEEVIPPTFCKQDSSKYVDDVNFYEGKAPFLDEKTSKIGYLDKQGKVVIVPKYEAAYKFENGQALIFESCNYWYINTKGEYIKAGESINRYNSPPAETGVVYDKETNQYGYKNNEKVWAVAPQYDNIQRVGKLLIAKERYYPMRKGSIHIMDTTGKMLWKGYATEVSIDAQQFMAVEWSLYNHYTLYNESFEKIWETDCAQIIHVGLETLTKCLPTDSLKINFSGYIDERLTPQDVVQLFNRTYNPIFLTIAHINIANVPKNIGNMTNLQRLEISKTQITDLPTKLSKLKNLHTLSLQGNQLKQVPAVIYKMKSLKNLHLNENPLPFQEIIKLKKTLPQLNFTF